MYEILSSLIKVIDDVLVHGTTQEEHNKNLLAVLNRIQEAGLTINKEKCIFSTNSIKFLGQAINEVPQPTVTELRQFLSMVKQLNKFSLPLTDHKKPLQDLLSSRNHWRWETSQETAFQNIKAALISVEILSLH